MRDFVWRVAGSRHLVELPVITIVIALAVGCAGPAAQSPVQSPSPTAAAAIHLPTAAATPSQAPPTPAPTPSLLATPSASPLPSPIVSPTPVAPSPSASSTPAPTPTASPGMPVLQLTDSDVLSLKLPNESYRLNAVNGTKVIVEVPYTGGATKRYDLKTGAVQRVSAPSDQGWHVHHVRTPLGVVSRWLKPAAWGWGTPGCWSAPFEWRITYRSFAGGTRLIAEGVDRYASGTPWIDEICADPFGGSFDVDPEGKQIVYAVDLTPRDGLRRPERLIVEDLESGLTVRTILASGPFWTLAIDNGRVAWTEVVTNVSYGNTKPPRLMLAEPGRRPIEVSDYATDVWLAADRVTWRQGQDWEPAMNCYSGRLRQLALGPGPAEAAAARYVSTSDACPVDVIQSGGDIVWVEEVGLDERVMALTRSASQPAEIQFPTDLMRFPDNDGHAWFLGLAAGGGWLAVQIEARIVAFPLDALVR